MQHPSQHHCGILGGCVEVFINERVWALPPQAPAPKQVSAGMTLPVLIV